MGQQQELRLEPVQRELNCPPLSECNRFSLGVLGG
jgi:hypothetical protein